MSPEQVAEIRKRAAAATPDILPERLRAKISVSESGCWFWLGHKNKSGYGTITWEGRSQQAGGAVMLTRNEVNDIRALAEQTQFRSAVALTHYQVEGLIEAWERLAVIAEVASGRTPTWKFEASKQEAR